MSALEKARTHRIKAGYAAPLQELGTANAKAVRDTTELYMGHRGIRYLESPDNNPFKVFVNLEALWLNHNSISDLKALSCCKRLKELYLDFNHITNIRRNDLTYNFLATLSLQNNQLRDLPSLLHALSKLGFLENLNLKGNPVTEELTYRVEVIAAMPRLRVLDDHEVSVAERHAAHNFKMAQQEQAKAAAKRRLDRAQFAVTAPTAGRHRRSRSRATSKHVDTAEAQQEEEKHIFVSSLYSHLVGKLKAADRAERRARAEAQAGHDPAHSAASGLREFMNSYAVNTNTNANTVGGGGHRKTGARVKMTAGAGAGGQHEQRTRRRAHSAAASGRGPRASAQRTEQGTKLNPRAPDYFSMFSYDVEPVSLEEAAQIDHRRPWRTAHLARRKVKAKVMPL